MVRIEAGEPERKGIWADGYMPTREQLVRMAQDRGYSRAMCTDPERRRSRPQLLYDLAGHFWRAAESEAWQKGELSADDKAMSDLFVLRIGVPETLGRVYNQSILDLAKEGSHPDYAALVFTFSELYWPTAPTYVGRVIDTLQFREKRPEEYEDFRTFRSFVELAIDWAITPYVAPCLAAEKNLQALGFEANYAAFAPEE
jgi:hypothetical protein